MRYLLTVIAFIMGFSALPVWAMNCYAEHEGGNTVVIGYVLRDPLIISPKRNHV